jgi:small subunit ribosomal protein S7
LKKVGDKAKMKIFDLFDVSDIKVEDPGLRRYIDIGGKLLIKNQGREGKEKFGRAKINILERFIHILMCPGHRGSKQKIMTHWASGKWSKKAMIMIKTLKIIEERTKQNPIQVFIKAVENAAPRDEVTTIEYGGARYPQAVDISPMRRISLAMRNMRNGAYDKSFGKSAKIENTLADEIIAASNNSTESKAIARKNETEKMADSSR